MAPVSVTIQSHQNHMLLTSGCNRIFLDTGAFRCKMALASVIMQFDQDHMLFTSGRNRIFLEAGTFDRCLSSTGTRVGDKSVTSKLHSIYYQTKQNIIGKRHLLMAGTRPATFSQKGGWLEAFQPLFHSTHYFAQF
jgi:hypothetical protein